MSLPNGWEATTLGDCQAKTQSIDPREFNNYEFDLFSVPSYTNYMPDRARGSEIGSTKQVVKPDDVLLCKIVPHIRRGWVVPSAGSREQIASGEWIIFRGTPLEPEFLRRFVLSDGFHDQFMRTVSGVGGSLMRARPADAAKISVPVPPAAEQLRIVAKLDSLTTRLVRARTELNRATGLAEDLRAKAVVAAFRGELSARWRETNSSTKVAPLRKSDTTRTRVADATRRKPVLSIDWKPELSIPNSWRWASVDEVVALVQYGTSAKTSDDQSGVPVLRMGNIQRGMLDWSKLKYLPAAHGEFPLLFLADGDVLFNRTNSLELVGKSAVYRGGREPASFASYLIRLRCSAIRPDLLVRYLNSPIGRSWVGRSASQQVGQANVNGTKLRALGIPLPPMPEQIEITRLLDSVFAHADRLEAEAARARGLLDRLESAILTKAFRGELVPQDPNDEPASFLLDRIRAERVAAPKVKRALIKRQEK